MMAALVLRGVTITAQAQWIMTGIEVTILAIFGVAALIHGGSAELLVVLGGGGATSVE